MIDDHPPLLVGGELKALASCHQPYLDSLVSTNGHQRVGIAVPLLQIALQEANAQRREEIVLLPRSSHGLSRPLSTGTSTLPRYCAMSG